MWFSRFHQHGTSGRSSGRTAVLVACVAVAVMQPACMTESRVASTETATSTAAPQRPANTMASRSETDAAAAGPTVPAVPDGTPEELLAFAKGLRSMKVRPRSQEEMLAYRKAAAAAAVQAADKILAQVAADDALHAEAATLKLDSLTLLGRVGDEQDLANAAAYAESLVRGRDPGLAKHAERILFVIAAERMFAAEKAEAAPALIRQLAGMVAADPDDMETANLAMQFAGSLQSLPDGVPLAIQAYESLGPLFARSTQPRVQQLGEMFAGSVRRLSLPGTPMEITGTLVDGTPFDQRSLAGKVVLVDFWATWCGPCIAEIPGVLAAYEKYHDRGFEVVGISLDEDRAELEAFLERRKIPWPVLFAAEADGDNPLARRYGITGIPQMILIGRDGNVITLNARGERLGEELAKLFADAP